MDKPDVIRSIPFTDEETWLKNRLNDVTSTEVSALFGVSPYITEFELWYRKREQASVKIELNERMEAGLELQDAIAEWAAKKMGWVIRKKTEYMRNETVRMGSSFDFEVEALDYEGRKSGEPLAKVEPFLLEIKNVDGLAYKEGWIVYDDDSVEAPVHIELQVQQQLAITGYGVAYIVALVGGNRLVFIRRERNEEIISEIRRKIVRFWDSVLRGIAPEPNFENDAKFISSLKVLSNPEETYNAKGNSEITEMLEEYRLAGEAEGKAKLKKEEVKAKILMIIGEAARVDGDGFSISTGTVAPCPMNYVRGAYRNFRPSFKKVKAEEKDDSK